MSKTIVGLGSPLAVQKFSVFLAKDVARDSYFNSKFMGTGIEAQTPVQMLPHLENDAGDKISYDLVMQMRMQPVEGDNILEGNEEALKFYTDSVNLDQMRTGVNAGGAMSRKRSIHDMRAIARMRESDHWARLFDELFFMYLSGARGVNDDFVFKPSYGGFASNPLTAPDAYHQIIQNGKTKETLSATTNGEGGDALTLSTIDIAVARSKTMGGGSSGIPRIEPCKINGEEHYVMVMHPFQEYAIRKNASTGQWLDIQKAAAAAEGRNNPIFKGNMGMYHNVVLHAHNATIRFDDYGASANVPAARALFMGRQAGVVAFGSPGNGLRFSWHEEVRDNGNQAVITSSTIFGVKKTSFKTENHGSLDFGVIAIDSAIGNPG